VERCARAAPSEVPQSLTRVNIQPGAEAEADEAAAWYEAQQPGLGIEFILELDAAIERAAETPLAYEPVFQEVRRVLLRRFPYAVYFVFERELVEIFAVLHQQRTPSRWQSRVRQ
jgi:plasmid stabilization system protein ParE